MPRSDQELIAGGVPWPAALVPLLAPLLPILLLVKLFRPKNLNDYWIFQTIALVIVTLSCILAGEVLFFILLTVYLITQIWCLCLFFLYQNMILNDPAAVPQGHDSRHVSLFGDGPIQDPHPHLREPVCARAGARLERGGPVRRARHFPAVAQVHRFSMGPVQAVGAGPNAWRGPAST